MIFSRIKRSYTNLTGLFLYPRILFALNQKRKLYFFFHSWSFGGAERVHISILKLFSTYKPLCFITDRSGNTGFKEEFKSNATLLNLGRWAEKNSYKRHLQRKLADSINAQESPVVFGCNSRFMYELIPLLAPHVKIIDLLHNFSDFREGAEWYSLPYIQRIDKRVVLGQKIWGRLKEHYIQNEISTTYLNKIEIIPNFVETSPSFVKKDFKNTLEVLFVARNSPEKRVNIIREIAFSCEKLSLPLRFTLIGDFEKLENLPANVSLAGEIYNQTFLKEYYQKSHLVILCSRREGLPLVILEGMSFGTIPISTRVGELDTFINANENNGYLIDNFGDDQQIANSFVQKLNELLLNRSELEVVSKNSYETVRKHFSPENFAAAYRRLILEKG